MKLQWKKVHVESHTSTTVVETPNLTNAENEPL